MIIKSERIYMEDGVKSGYLEIRGGKFISFSEEAPEIGRASCRERV